MKVVRTIDQSNIFVFSGESLSAIKSRDSYLKRRDSYFIRQFCRQWIPFLKILNTFSFHFSIQSVYMEFSDLSNLLIQAVHTHKTA